MVSVLGRDRASKSAAADVLSLRIMLEVTLLNAALAVFPLPFLEPGTLEPGIWRIASGLHLIGGIGLASFGIYRYRIGLPDPDPLWISVLVTGLSVISLLVDFANVVGVAGANAFSLFLAALLLSLTVGGLKFIVVAGSIFDVAES